MFISLEGCDGAGKSTAAKGLCAGLEAAGHRVLLLNPKRPQAKDAYVAQHLQGLSKVLWESNTSEPRNVLRDRHWVYLSAAWFQVVDQHVLQPALATHDFVVADSWYTKLLARFRLKGTALFEEARRCYASLTKPGLGCMLDVAPEVAAGRKVSFGYSETGNFDGLQGVTRENFVRYQSWVRDSLLDMVREEGWFRLDVGLMPAPAVARELLAHAQATRESAA
jgi:dTMP kinase